jgi:putative PIN family toxin of toxin-antitoxin system
MTVVVDTSVFVAALKSSDGASRQVLRLCLQGQVAPVMGQKLFLEFLDVFQRPGLFAKSRATVAEREALLYGFLAVCRWVEIYFIWRPNLPDESDNHVVELAIAGGATAIITHNVTDFAGELRFPGVEILTPAQYLKSLR